MRRVLALTVATTVGLLALANSASATGDPPALVQLNDSIVSSGATVRSALDSPTASGNLIVAYVVWDNAGTVSVSDSQGNAYRTAGGRTRWDAGGGYSAQLFYAEDVKGGATTVRARFGRSTTAFGILYVQEYSGVARTAALDGARAAKGVGTAMDSGAVTTTNAHDLLVGAGASVGAVTSGGPGYTVRSTAYGNLVEDRVVTSSGSYSATATHTGGNWVMQVAAFKAANPAGDTSPPSVPADLSATPVSDSEIDLSWSPSTDDVGVAGYDVYRDGTRVDTVTGTTYRDTGLAAHTTHSYTVRAFDAAGNASAQSESASATTFPPLGCPLPLYPKPACTGLPSGTTFTRVVEGDYFATTPGEVIDRWHIKGSLIVAAEDVVITGSQIDDSVMNDDTPGEHRFTITDTTVGPEVCGTPNDRPNAIGAAHYTATRVEIRGHEDGFRAAGPDVTVRDSYYRACVFPGDHGDGIQDYPAAQDLVFEHNTVDSSGFASGINAPIFIFSDATVGARIVNNLALGGAYGVFVKPANGTWVVAGNRVVDGTWAFGPYHADVYCDRVEWSDNTVVTVDSDYNVTSTVRTEPCPR
jgi:hypothetical protein